MIRGIIELNIDTKAIERLEEEFKGRIAEGMDELLEEVEWTWRTEAGRQLNESKEKYLAALRFERTPEGFRALLGGGSELEDGGWLINAIEFGAPRFDLRPGFLKGGRLTRAIPMGYPTPNRVFTITQWPQNTPNNWHHPGLEPKAIHKTVEDKMNNDIVPQVFDRMISSIKI